MIVYTVQKYELKRCYLTGMEMSRGNGRKLKG